MLKVKSIIQTLLLVCIGVLFTEAQIRHIEPEPGVEPIRIPVRDPCAFFACLHGGSCVAPADRPRCECPPGFTGHRCQTRTPSRDPCVHFSCQNGGRCVAPADIPRCECPSGFTGSRCQTRSGVASCGPCPNGWRCRSEPVVCVRAPCLAAFTCLPPAVLTDDCGGCPAGKTCRTFYPPCPPPPFDCEFGGGLLESLTQRRRRRRRSFLCPDYRCDPVHVCQ